MTAGWALRLILASLMIGLGAIIAGRSLWLALAHGVALPALVQPVGVGLLMIALGVSRWRLWARMHRTR